MATPHKVTDRMRALCEYIMGSGGPNMKGAAEVLAERLTEIGPGRIIAVFKHSGPPMTCIGDRYELWYWSEDPCPTTPERSPSSA